MPNENILVTELSDSEVEELENSSDVETIEKNIIVSGNASKKSKKNNKKATDKQWNKKMIKADKAKENKKSSKKENSNEEKVKVAILDSGIDGFAMHTATDVYAHSTYVYHDDKWKLLVHKNDLNIFNGGNWFTLGYDADDVYEYKNRYACAKDVACNVFERYKYGKVGSYTDFYAKSYDGTFKVANLYEFSSQLAKKMGDTTTTIQKFLQKANYSFKAV